MLFLNHIPNNRRGLVFKNGDYKRLLLPGSHFIFPGEEIHLSDVMLPFHPPIPLNFLLTDARLTDQLEIVEVLQNQIVLVFQDNIYTQFLKAGKYAFWKGEARWAFRKFDLNDPRIPNDLNKEILQTLAAQEAVYYFIVYPNHKAALFIDQKFVEALEPGGFYFWNTALAVDVVSIDLRLQQKEISGQELLTKDRIMLRINFVFKYKVFDPILLIREVANLDEQLHVIFQLVLREYIGSLTLDEILQRKEEIGAFVLEKVAPELQKIGLVGHQSGVKDIILPGEIKEILNQVLIAEKNAQASVITRREETASTRNLLNTAKLMEENPILYRLKELEYVERIMAKVNEINVNGGSSLLEQLRNIALSKENGK
ncbi:SPFH domain-containing protein [Leptospira idonii]|uniref:Slipin family protein n=1 Tax=Leptospira idonii TaxID=1193500 RepID=A0A4V3JXP7_9LEPT|nr:SPFH domain-containing protein [Leptospira idonii]TGN18043.1 slipin family protein [Leptospira idonii]